MAEQTKVTTLEKVVIRFSGDSGDGMQLTGTIFSNLSAIFGNEIAIRKVNGATTRTVMQMMLRKYFKLLGLAFIISLPVSLLAIFKYLENFANKAPISWWIFAVALLITAGISLATLIWQIRKAARTNPAEAIKAE